MSRILSFDIGTINLAYCMLENEYHPERTTEFRIARGTEEMDLYWGLINCGSNNLDIAAKNLAKTLLEKKEIFFTADTVLIERQFRTSSVMTGLSHIIQTFFIIVSLMENRPTPTIKFISPRKKLEVYTKERFVLTCSEGHYRNKKLAVLHTNALLAEDPEALTILSRERKIDDLCDSFLQGAWWIKNKKLTGRKRTVEKTNEIDLPTNEKKPKKTRKTKVSPYFATPQPEVPVVVIEEDGEEGGAINTIHNL